MICKKSRKAFFLLGMIKFKLPEMEFEKKMMGSDLKANFLLG